MEAKLYHFKKSIEIMAYTAREAAQVTETFENENIINEKVDLLVSWIQESNHMVAFTGAGISTSAGIADFRGPTGKWTMQAQGKKCKSKTTTIRAIPTPTHMTLVKLQEENILKYIISQNTDGLIRRSGFPKDKLSELHGNTNIEVCEECGQSYFRDGSARRMKKGADHFTGRFCKRADCNGRLIGWTIDFGQNLPTKPLQKAEEHAGLADLHLCLGSSLTVSPANDQPQTTKENGGKLVIVNLQETPLTEMADLHIYGKTDEVMAKVMERLGLEIPEFRLLRKIVVGAQPLESEEPHLYKKAVVYCRGAEVDDPSLEMDVIKFVSCSDFESRPRETPDEEREFPEQREYELPRDGAAKYINEVTIPCYELRNNPDICFQARLRFQRHYGEPDLELDWNLTPAFYGSGIEYIYSLEFNPYTKKWQYEHALSDYDPLEDKRSKEIDPKYGISHRAYVVSRLMRRYKIDETDARQMFFRKKAESIEKRLPIR